MSCRRHQEGADHGEQAQRLRAVRDLRLSGRAMWLHVAIKLAICGAQERYRHNVCSHSACTAGATKREPIVVGKPSDFVLSAISDFVGVPRNRMCMIGDRLDTDILFGQQGGLSSMLVLSGVFLVSVLQTGWLT